MTEDSLEFQAVSCFAFNLSKKWKIEEHGTGDFGNEPQIDEQGTAEM
ncbi:MAG: hypothetical protein ACYC3X_25835 [Pirellulaceae bacterium]